MMTSLGARSTCLRHGLGVLICWLALASCSQDKGSNPVQQGWEYDARSGGAATTMDGSVNAFGNASPALSMDERLRFQTGNSFFRNNWVAAPSSTTARDGLGPFFDARSCGSCHTFDGRGRPPAFPGDPASGMVYKLGRAGVDGLLPDDIYGGAMNSFAIPGVEPEGRVEVAYVEEPGNYPDGTVYSLRRPVYKVYGGVYGAVDGATHVLPRIAPQMIGMGLLEAVDQATLQRIAGSQVAPVSGTLRYVPDPIAAHPVVGRFGWKAGQPSVRTQTAAAFVNDIGITNTLHEKEDITSAQWGRLGTLPDGGHPEIDDDMLDAVAFYSATLAVPARRNVDDPAVVRGARNFTAVRCTSCHVPVLTTGSQAVVAAYRNQTIHPFTDLLLHDMGSGLADPIGDGIVGAGEWRTPPLWGLGLIAVVNKHTFLLHDGRARTIEEAILWHDGEAASSRSAFKSLNAAERADLLRFMESL
ncbi:MAG: thiol oxidoreductase ['Candidatus Kapabacteria' thiocyanatum]|nr:thiol oxidoreductase ['Candidatus Kapabacteria' thiocyanatum]